MATTDEAAGLTTISWRMKDDRPLFFEPPPQAVPKFPELARLKDRETELIDPGNTTLSVPSSFREPDTD